MKYGSKEHIDALTLENNTLAKRLNDAQKRIEALEAKVEQLDAIRQKCYKAIYRVVGIEQPVLPIDTESLLHEACEASRYPIEQPTAAEATS